MTQRLVIPLVVVIAFGAGFGARLWTEGERALPPPPTSLGGEFVRPPAVPEKKSSVKPYNRLELVSDIERLRPQIEAFRVRFEAIDAEYEKAFAKILDAEQKCVYDAKIAAAEKRRLDHESKAAAAPPPPLLSDEEIAKLRQRPFETVFWKMSITAKLEQTVHDYKLTPEQQAKERELLVARREKFLELLDSTPLPTVRMTSLAPAVERLIDPAAKSAGAISPAK
jgi:hypothetical protein